MFFIFLAEFDYTGIFHGLFNELEWVAIISVKKSCIWLNIWAKGGKKWPKACQSMLYAVTNNAITSEANSIFPWNKK